MNSAKFKPTSILSLNKIKSLFLKKKSKLKNPWKPTQIKPQSKPNNHLNQKPQIQRQTGNPFCRSCLINDNDHTTTEIGDF